MSSKSPPAISDSASLWEQWFGKRSKTQEDKSQEDAYLQRLRQAAQEAKPKRDREKCKRFIVEVDVDKRLVRGNEKARCHVHLTPDGHVYFDADWGLRITVRYTRLPD